MSFRVTMIAGALLAGLTLPATVEAALMRTTTDLNMRNSPGGARIAVIPGGAQVEVDARSGGWCRVEWRGYRGWSSCNYLTASAGGRYYTSAPQPGIGLYFSIPGSRSFFDRDRDRRYDRDRRDWRDYRYRDGRRY